MLQTRKQPRVFIFAAVKAQPVPVLPVLIVCGMIGVTIALRVAGVSMSTIRGLKLVGLLVSGLVLGAIAIVADIGNRRTSIPQTTQTVTANSGQPSGSGAAASNRRRTNRSAEPPHASE
jgi:hypothetical protein